MKAFYLIATVMMINFSAMASEIICVDTDLQDSQVTAVFQIKNGKVTVKVGIPTGETSTEDAKGSCVSEEDTDYLSLRCNKVTTSSGVQYFARIDDLTATVSKDGEIIARIPCTLEQ